jgi:type I restriction enzyme R subunit
LNEEAEKRLHRQFGQLYHLVTRGDRLDKVADDVARHFAARGYLGKGMFVAIDKATAVSMHNQVRAAWDRLIAEKACELDASPAVAREALAVRLAWMRAVDMAVVVSNSQGEVAELAGKGLDILPHRERIKNEDLEAKFKDGGDPLSLVFVCAMWITGFDVPTCSTVYIDKPMKNHTLMQTIARANRRAAGKTAGLIVDYIGVFQNLQKALAIYAAGGSKGDLPIRDKSALLAKLDEALGEAAAFCASVGIDPFAMLACDKMERLKRIAEAVNVLVAPDDRRRAFLALSGSAAQAYKAVLPDEAAAPYLQRVAALQVLSEAVRGCMGTPDLSAIYARIEALLDERIEGVAITTPIIVGDEPSRRVDLSTIDFEKLAALFTKEPRTAAEKARKSAEERVKAMMMENPTRRDLADKLAEMVAAYNANSIDAERFFEQLKALVAELDEEDRRAAREGLTESELAIFDILTRPEPKLTKSEEVAVKAVARELHEKVLALVAIPEWQNAPRPRAEVQSAIRFTLNALPESPYPQTVWESKVSGVWEHVLARYRRDAGIMRRAA